MTYTRKDTQTYKILYLLAIIAGIGLAYWSATELDSIWRFLLVPLGLLIAFSFYKNYKKTNWEIAELDFGADELQITFLNGQHRSIQYKNLNYAVLVKKFHQPIRAIEFIEKNKVGLFRGKSIGQISVSKWDDNLQAITKHLISQQLKRKKWSFGWSFGEILMVFSILLGATESIAESYINDLELHLSETTGEISEVIVDEKNRTRHENEKAEKRFFGDN